MREEKAIFNDLANLCSSSGYAHVIAYLCFRDYTIGYSEQLAPSSMAHQFSWEKLVRNEVSTLIGLMFKTEIDLALPKPEILDSMIQRTELLLKEMHQSLITPLTVVLNPSDNEQDDLNPFTQGSFLRETVFYSGESAYNFQYRGFSLKKYAKDNDWFQANKGFTIEDANTVLSCIENIQNEKILNQLKSLEGVDPHNWTMLPAFIFTAKEIAKHSGIRKSIVDKILEAFIPPNGMRNQEFNALNDFNITNAYPLIYLNNDEYLLFLNYSLTEALYETPYYWLSNDKNYIIKAMKHRGEFTEEFSAEKLKLVFGKHRVFSNIKLIDRKMPKRGKKQEIDVLVVFGDRAIIVQAKSKRLSLDAKKGNDNSIKDDFKKSTQSAYDQGLLCAKLLTDENYKLIDAEANEITISKQFKEIYIFCVISDHYPALSFQARQFLKYEKTSNIMLPFVMDIFLLDVMTEMLQSPLYFLSYINRRTQYLEKILATKELIILSYHLKKNLWINKKFDLINLDDDICMDLDVAMMVRRLGISGEATPDGILTRIKDTAVGNLIREIEQSEDPITIDLGFMLLTLSEETLTQINKGIEAIVDLTKKDRKPHDFTVIVDGIGITIHCNYNSTAIASSKLQGHCEIRKYIGKANKWFGICITPDNSALRLGLELDYPWQVSDEMDALVKDFKTNKKHKSMTKFKGTGKIGRNEKCPCGSGIKFKKCCF